MRLLSPLPLAAYLLWLANLCRTRIRYCIPSVLTPDGKYLISSDEAEDKESKEGGYRVVKWDLQTRQIVDSWIAHKGKSNGSSLFSVSFEVVSSD